MIWGTIGLVGVGMLVGLPIAAHIYLQDDWLFGAAALVPLSAAAIGWWFAEHDQPRQAAATLATLGVGLA